MFLLSFTALAGLAAAQGPAVADDQLYGGGGTLASRVFRDLFDCYGTALPGSLVPAGITCPHNAVEIFYAPVGSGAGQRAWLNHDGSNAGTGLGTPAASNPVPYTDPNASPAQTYASGYPNLHFSGSDAFVSASQATTYNSGTDLTSFGNGKQVPMFVATVSIPFNSNVTNGASDTFTHPSSITQPTDGNAKLTLSANSLCGIFTGAITNWNDASLTADNGGTPLVSSSAPIKIVIRSDGSGTTFLQGSYLAAQCASTSHSYTGTVSTASASTFSQLLAANGSNVIQSSGSGGVQAGVKATAFSIGYVSADFAQQVTDGSGNVLMGGDPSGPVSANVINPLDHTCDGSGVTTGTAIGCAASVNNAALAIGGTTAPEQSSTDDVMTDWGQPTDANAPVRVASSYPVIGYTFVETYSCFAGSAAAGHLSDFFNWMYNDPNGAPPAILQAHGFTPLPFGPSSDLTNMLVFNTGSSGSALSNAGASGTQCSGTSPGA
jgi:ABC-type phosphate transport system substrate-binding protein